MINAQGYSMIMRKLSVLFPSLSPSQIRKKKDIEQSKVLKKGKEEPEFLRHGIKGGQKKGRLPLSSLVFQFHTPAAQKAREEKLLLPLLSFFLSPSYLAGRG